MAYTSQPVGFLASVVSRIRENCDEPSDLPKWTTDRLWPNMRTAWRSVVRELNNLSDTRLTGRFDISVTPSTYSYQLPGNVGTILRIGKVDSSGYFTEYFTQRSRLNPWGPSYVIEGNRLRFEPYPTITDTFTVEYVANGDCWCHLGTCAHTGTAISTLTLNPSPSEGYFDKRPNGYLGYMLNVLAHSTSAPYTIGGTSYVAFPQQQRLITQHVTNTGVVTVSPDFDGNLGSLSGTYTYEVVPMYADLLESAVVYKTSMILNTIEDRPKRAGEMQALYRDEMRSLRQELSNVNGRTGNRWEGDVPGSGRWGGGFVY